jgi:hypothetical protein
MDLYLVGLTLGNVSISGDDGQPNVKLVQLNSALVPVEKALGNVLFCQSCSTLIGNSKIQVRIGDATGKILTAAKMLTLQSGTMFDLDDDGIVDAAENLDLVDKTAITDADSPYTVLEDDKLIECDASGAIIGATLPAGVDGKMYTFKDGEGSAGTNNITITPDGTETIQGAGTYVINTDFGFVQMYYDEASTDWKTLDETAGSTAAVALNTAHRTGDGSDHADVATNTTHSTGDGSDHADVATNTARLAVIKAGSFVDSEDQAVAGTTNIRRFIATQAGTIDRFMAQAGTGAGVGEDTTCDVLINAISALSAVAVVDQAAGTTAQAGTVNLAANAFVAGDIITVTQTYTPGTPTPMTNIMTSIQCSFD